MRKVIVITLLIILIPYFIVSFFIPDEEEINFEYMSNRSVRVRREKTGTIDKVPFEEYVAGVLAGEMPLNFHIEALKAQSVAARSYVMKKIGDSVGKEYDVVDTVSNQVYLDDATMKEKWKSQYDEKMALLKKVIYATRGEYLEYDGKVAEAFFFSTSTGKTENSEEVFQAALPYLRSVDSKWDEAVSPVFRVNYDMSTSDFYTKLGLPYANDFHYQVTKKTSTGRVKEVNINGTVISASDIYSKLKLRSTFFTIEQVGTNIHITTKGFGHGVGMSQYGAEGMAQNGYKYDEILKYYYQGVIINKI